MAGAYEGVTNILSLTLGDSVSAKLFQRIGDGSFGFTRVIAAGFPIYFFETVDVVRVAPSNRDALMRHLWQSGMRCAGRLLKSKF